MAGTQYSEYPALYQNADITLLSVLLMVSLALALVCRSHVCRLFCLMVCVAAGLCIWMIRA